MLEPRFLRNIGARFFVFFFNFDIYVSSNKLSRGLGISSHQTVNLNNVQITEDLIDF